ncbi:trehalose 6-phosphate synthase [Hasllibacter halocynthiae]|uniref:Trehalose 6-phosphate synthase n=1 Tax=Hasllibacter halocynthiae TaxID=595589 RepID=A0A2T0X1X7_9RHOB|nr:trehalose-6-phosphate synthase [Hasllibacter halocynthiae]PRY92895.1 trehalose 6-phosphate synthase [Hasllibacter halocynthiae]
MSRLVVVSNRLPLGDNPSGGLVVALEEALSGGGVWVGNSGTPVDAVEERLTPHPGAAFDRLSFDVTHEEHENYYAGFANSVLWPLCHGRVDLMRMRPDYPSAYRRVNRRIARLIAGIVEPEDRIWVHDYHHLPLAYELRQLGVSNPVAFFLHIPFPGPMAFQALPNSAETARWIAAFDLFGLQSMRDVSACLEAFRTVPEASILLNGRMALRGEEVRVASYPIGIDVEEFARTAAAAPPRDTEGRATVIGVDRLDYSKGLPQRFRAFGTLLDRRPDLHGKVELLQIAPPTREEVEAYREIREELERMTGAINGAHADLDWTPIRYIHRPVPRDRLAGLYRAAYVGLVTPLADGMNLVAKEYMAAQDPKDPGVLILSKFAGAAEQMPEALIVNPHDGEDMVQAMVTALWMPLGERRERHGAIMKGMRARDVHWWRRAILADLERVAQGDAPKAA